MTEREERLARIARVYPEAAREAGWEENKVSLKRADRCRVCLSREKGDPRHGPVKDCLGPGKPCEAPKDHHEFQPEEDCPTCGQKLPAKQEVT